MKHNARSRGVATLVAIFLLGIVGMALVAVTSHLAHDGQRTRDARCGAQLRQLLLAGAAAARDDAARWDGATSPQQVELTLPAELSNMGAAVVVTLSGGSGRVTAQVEAGLDSRSARQTVVLIKEDGAWRILEAILGSDG